ncbi:leucine-rich repeat-containing protein 29, partial [Bos mutus]|uniref:leucine-rich repeat-containing protein 29 n=1 Tax=Bos mutus TaxID=72004 RepID=UPI0038B51592
LRLPEPAGLHFPESLARGRRRQGCDGGVAAAGDGHIYSELPASVRSERGLPREPGLVLCSPDCPSGEAVAALCHQQPGLTSLDLSGCSELADGAVLAVSRGLRHLRRLSLRKLQRLTDAGCSALGGLCELQSLDLAECCLVRGRELAQSLGSVCAAPPPLASLSLAYCSSLKDASVLSLIPGLGPRLRVLDLSSCVALTNQTLQAICTYLTRLSVLRLAWCKELGDWGLLGLGEPIQAPSQEPQVLQFPQLRQLSLSLLPALTDKALVAVAKGCPSLERLALSHCSLLSDQGWAQAASSWPRLQHLNLSSCSQLTEQTLDSVGQACRQLRMVDVAMCPGISIASVRRFQAQLPEVICIQSRFVGGADLTLTL